MVAAATHSLCEAANAMVQGHASEEKLIASAKEVAGSTAQLLMACKVKADPGSVAMQRLQVMELEIDFQTYCTLFLYYYYYEIVQFVSYSSCSDYYYYERV